MCGADANSLTSTVSYDHTPETHQSVLIFCCEFIQIECNYIYRLSWSYLNGGMQAGSITPGRDNTIYRKIIYYKYCPDTVTTTTPPQESSSISPCIVSNTVVHYWNLNYLYNDGWNICYNKPYSDSTNIEDLLSICPTGSDYYYFVGALSTNASQYVLLGAYGPSRVLTEFTTSTTQAKKPIEYENTDYNVYWYNYLPGSGYIKAFGFTSISNINLIQYTPTPSSSYGYL